MNFLRKVWSPYSVEKSKFNGKESVTLVNVIRFNDSCFPRRDFLTDRPSQIHTTESVQPYTPNYELDQPIAKWNDEKLRNMIQSCQLDLYNMRKPSVVISQCATFNRKKSISLIPLFKISRCSTRNVKNRCLRSNSAKPIMATIKYKDPEFSNRRTRSAVSVYLLDHLMESKRLEFLENTYGGKFIAHRSARIIQRCFRNYVATKLTTRIYSTLSNDSSPSWISKENNEKLEQRISEISVNSTVNTDKVYDANDPFAIHDDENRKRIYYIGRNLFNKNCNKGITFLIKHGILDSDGPSIVKFFNSDGLSSYAKGDFMSQDKNRLSIATRKEFLAKMSFHNCSIESGVRQLFSKIRIPGETQKILNMLEEFHTVYLSQNPEFRDQLKKQDTVVLISFAILMVHTSLYNPSAAKQDKMTKEQFIAIFKNLNEENFITEEYLSDLYDNIKKKQMKPLSDHTDLVRNVYHHLTGPLLPKDLIQNHRKLICQYNCSEIPNINKKPNSHAHNRELFLFNDLLIVTKKGRSNTEYHVRHSIPLLGLILNQFRSEYYAFGVEIIQTGRKKPLIYLDCISLIEREKLITDISQYVEEVRQLDVLRIEEEINKLNKDI